MGVVTGFTTILVVVGVGVLLAHAGVLDVRGQRALGDVTYLVAAPALMLQTISTLELDTGVLLNLAASVVSLLVAGGGYALVSALLWRRGAAESLVGALSSGYVNAANIGIPVAGYVLGDVTVVAPALLLQLVVVQPLAVAVLDRVAPRPSTDGRPRPRWRRMLPNPLLLGSLAGLVLAATGWRLPEPVAAPLSLLAGLAVPAMLIAFGVSLRLNPLLGRSGSNRQVALASTLKLVVQPLTAWLAGTLLGLEGPVLLGVVMTAALPTAQNVFLHAMRHRSGEAVARETISVTTVACLPVCLLVALLLG